MFQKTQLLIIDLDFLLFDCLLLKERTLRQSLLSVAELIPQSARLPDGIDIEERYLEHGYRWAKYLELGLDKEQMESFAREYGTIEPAVVESGGGRLFEGLLGSIKSWKHGGLRVALGSDARRDYLLAVSDCFGLDGHVDTLVCSEEYGGGGVGEMLDEIAYLSEVHPSETVVLGTRPAFFQAARDNDMMSVGCGWGIRNQAILETADLNAQTVNDLEHTIQEVDRISYERSL